MASKKEKDLSRSFDTSKEHENLLNIPHSQGRGLPTRGFSWLRQEQGRKNFSGGIPTGDD